MEIIEHGTTHKQKKCKYCNCKFAYSQKDIKINLQSEYYDNYVNCPECNYMNVLEDWEL